VRVELQAARTGEARKKAGLRRRPADEVSAVPRPTGKRQKKTGLRRSFFVAAHRDAAGVL